MKERPYRAYKAVAWLETAWLIIFGFLLFGYVRAGQLKLFLSPGWTWLIIAAGAVSVLMGTALLLFGREQEEALIRDYMETGGKYDAVYRILAVVLLVGIIAIGFVVPGRTLTVNLQDIKDVAGGAFVDTSDESYRKAMAIPSEERNIKDWIMIFRREDDPGAHEGEEVQLTGRVWIDEGLPREQFVVARYLLTHCISCASPLFILCRMDGEQSVPDENDWIRLEGELAATSRDEEEVPIIDVSRYEVIETPTDPYLYP